MSQLFRTTHVDPLAPSVDTWPYVHNICGRLALDKGSLYRSYMELFEDGEYAYAVREDRADVLLGATGEEKLTSLIRDSHVFDGDFEAEMLHEDLLVVVLLNEAGNDEEDAKQEKEKVQEQVVLELDPPFEGDRMNERGVEARHADEPADKISPTISSPHAAITPSTPAVEILSKVSSAKRIRKAVGGWEEKMLAEEAQKFLTKGRRSMGRSGVGTVSDGSRRSSIKGADYSEVSDWCGYVVEVVAHGCLMERVDVVLTGTKAQ